MRRVRSEEHVAGLGTKPLSKAAIANHCFTLEHMNMNDEVSRMDDKPQRCH